MVKPIKGDWCVTEENMKLVLDAMNSVLDEKQSRILKGGFAYMLGYGGQDAIHRITGSASATIRRGTQEILQIAETGGCDTPNDRVRKEGGGRKKTVEHFPGLEKQINEIAREYAYGPPTDTRKWIRVTPGNVAEMLKEDHQINVSTDVVGTILKQLGFSLQKNQKYLQVSKPHPLRNDQFEHIFKTVREFKESGDPCVSVDAKKKEKLGLFQNGGTEYRLLKDARPVLDHDFEIKGQGHVVPYGIYDCFSNKGFFMLGTNKDTAEFAVGALYAWWTEVGRIEYPNATRILVTCDGGGSNSSSSRLWKAELAAFAQLTGLEVHVLHYPPGTSKHNKIEHRLFSYVSKNWAGQPLTCIEVVKKLIESTTTSTGLSVMCRIDTNEYPIGIRISDEEFDDIKITYSGPNEKWSYVITGFKTIIDRPLGTHLRATCSGEEAA